MIVVNKIILVFFSLIFVTLSSCDFNSGRTLRMTIDNECIAESGTRISLSREASKSYYACLMSSDEDVVLGWRVNNRDPEKWESERYKAIRFRAKSNKCKLSFETDDVAIIVEVTDVTGKFVSGRFSGRVGIGPGTHRISEGTFRAPVEYWNREY